VEGRPAAASATLPLTPDAEDLLLRAASAAPSVHNTQPWQFAVGPEHVVVFADPSRRLRHGDPEGRSMLVSVGAAVLDLRVTLDHLGLAADVRLDPALDTSLLDHLEHRSDAPFPVARVTAAGPGGSAGLGRLLPAMWARRTNRRPFGPEPVPPVLLEALSAAAEAEGARLRPVVDPPSVAAVVELLRAAESAEAADPGLLSERAAHVGGPGRSTGIPVASLGPRPSGPAGAATRDLGVGVAAVRESAAFESAPTLALLGTPDDKPADWVRAGQALQRLWLELTAAGLHASLLNQPLENPRLRAMLLPLAPGAGAAAQVLLRFGHGEPVPPTPRRPVSEVRRSPA
jgi:nitroreductase